MKYLLLLSTTLLLLNARCDKGAAAESSWSKSGLLFEDSGTDNWKAKWILDGQRAKVINDKNGMKLIAGSEHGNDTCHTVLWTKQTFQGNICIEYDYTRTDTMNQYVNILYFLATGEGDVAYPSDISLWNDKRMVPHMRTYFNHMNTYHISYAAFGPKATSVNDDYIRLRRYNPSKGGLKGTAIAEDYFQTGLFKPNVTYRIKVIKFENQIEMHIKNVEEASEELICQWDAAEFPTCESGRIGFRHMYTRQARYRDIKVWSLEKKDS